MVMRYSVATRAVMPFERTAFQGLTLCRRVKTGEMVVDLSRSSVGWEAEVDKSVLFPTGSIDDVFLHVSSQMYYGLNPKRRNLECTASFPSVSG